MSDRPIFPERDAGSPLWTPADRLVDPDGNRLALQSEITGGGPGAALWVTGGGINTAGNGGTNIIVLTAAQLTAAVKWLRVFTKQSLTGWPAYYTSGHHLIDVRNGLTWYIHGLLVGATAGSGGLGTYYNGAVLGGGAPGTALTNLINIGQLAYIHTVTVNPVTRNLTLQAVYTAPGVMASWAMIEAYA